MNRAVNRFVIEVLDVVGLDVIIVHADMHSLVVDAVEMDVAIGSDMALLIPPCTAKFRVSKLWVLSLRHHFFGCCCNTTGLRANRELRKHEKCEQRQPSIPEPYQDHFAKLFQTLTMHKTAQPEESPAWAHGS